MNTANLTNRNKTKMNPSRPNLDWRSALVASAFLIPSLVSAQPLVYEGTLTHNGSAPVDEVPILRLALSDADGLEQWSRVIASEELDELLDDMGRFALVLDEGTLADGEIGPIPALGAGSALAVAVCSTMACDDWEPLGDPQTIGVVPRAHQAVEALRALDVAPEAVHSTMYQMTDLVVAQRPEAGEFGSLAEALASIEDKLLHPVRGLTINVGRGVYSHDEPLLFSRPDGHLLRIVGAGQEETILRFPESAGVVIAPGGALGMLDGLTLRGQYELGVDDGSRHIGVSAGPQGRIHLGRDLLIERFSHSCIRGESSEVLAEGVSIRICRSGMVAYFNATIVADEASIANTVTYAVLAGYGGSVISCNRCTIGNGGEGVYAHYGAHVYARRSRIDHASFSSYSLRARYGGTVTADTAQRPIRFEVDNHSFLHF